MKPDGPPEGWGAIDGRIKNAGRLNAGRRKLADAALRCFTERGYSETSVNDVADAAGVSIGSVYKYVRAKEDLLWLVSEDGFQRTNNAMASALSLGSDATTRLLALVDASIRQVDADRDVARLLYVEFQHMPRESQQRLRRQEKEQVNHVAALIKEGVAAAEFDCPQPRSVAITIGMFTSMWVLKRHLFERMTLDTFIAEQQAAALRLVGRPATVFPAV